MRGKLLFITGGLIGYVLGARAGRKRYEQIKSAADSFWNAEPVQRRVGDVRDFALDKVGDVPAALFDAGKKVVNSVIDKAGSGSKSGSRGKGASGTSKGAASKTTNAATAEKSAASSAPRSTASKSTGSTPVVKPTSTRAKTDPSPQAGGGASKPGSSDDASDA